MKKNIFCFVLGMALVSGITVVALSSKGVSFTPEDSNWKVDNVEDAINSLYNSSSEKSMEFGEVYTNYVFDSVKDELSLTLDLDAGSYICEANSSIAYNGPTAKDSLAGTWDIVEIEGAPYYKKLKYVYLKNSGSAVHPDLSSINDKYLYTYNGSEIFTCQSDTNFTITQTTALGWTNDICPIIMNVKCVSIK